MNTIDLVCTVEQSKRLVELGISRESIFSHMPKKNEVHGEYVAYGRFGDSIAPAYTASELAEILPSELPRDCISTWIIHLELIFTMPNSESDEYTAGYIEITPDLDYGGWIYCESGKTEAQARAKLLIQLLERGLI